MGLVASLKGCQSRDPVLLGALLTTKGLPKVLLGVSSKSTVLCDHELGFGQDVLAGSCCAALVQYVASWISLASLAPLCLYVCRLVCG